MASGSEFYHGGSSIKARTAASRRNANMSDWGNAWRDTSSDAPF